MIPVVHTHCPFRYRETGTFILKGVDDLQTLLDEHVTMTQAMQFSAFKKPFEDRIDSWAETLSTVSDVLEEWIKVQRSWLYLQPIFDSSDIQRQLPTEYKRFSTVDKNWRQTLAQAKSHPKAIKFCANEKLLEKFQESNKFLDLVQKGLSDYLETKRAAFARFYFLSNDELLEVGVGRVCCVWYVLVCEGRVACVCRTCCVWCVVCGV
jgi:dynein heavy chain